VRQIFAWVGLERFSIGEVCRRLKAQTIPSHKGKSYWDRSTVWGILKNPAYKGQAQFSKTQVGPRRPRLRPLRGKKAQPRRAVAVRDTPEEDRIAIEVPALVGEEVFAAVAEQLQENRRRCRTRRRGASYLLQGLLVCGTCGYAYYGKPISQSSRKGKTRDYAYYRCVGSDAYRFGGQRVCSNAQCRTDLVDKAVWDDACALLADPERVRREYDRRRRGQKTKGNRRSEQVNKLIENVRRGMGRLIDAYGEGLLEKSEFEPRICEARARLARLTSEAEAAAKRESEEADFTAAIEQLEAFAQRVGEGLGEADWDSRRAILRALIKQVEVGKDAIRIVYKVNPDPFEQGPSGGRKQDCWRGALTVSSQRVPALCAGHLVRAGGETAVEGACVPHSLRGRLRHWFYQRGGRTASVGGIAETIR
jgi:site-specific DNA recombinase